MNRIPWDEYEAAILLQTLLDVQDKGISRTEAISDTSQRLRTMAHNRGIAIDGVFRNKAGITLRLAELDSVFTQKPSKLPSAKWMYDICDIYKNDCRRFAQLVCKANEMIDLPQNIGKSIQTKAEISSKGSCQGEMNFLESVDLAAFGNTRPDSVVYYGDKKPTASWRLLYFIALKLIAVKHPDVMMQLDGKSILGSTVEIGSETEIREFAHPLGIMRKPDGKWLFAETDFNTQQILLRLKKLLELCNDPQDSLTIYFSAGLLQNAALQSKSSSSSIIQKTLAEIFQPPIQPMIPKEITDEQKYFQWLIQKGEKPSEVQAEFSMSEKVVNRLQISYRKLFSVTNPKEIQRIQVSLKSSPQWRLFGSRQRQQILHSMELYQKFREETSAATIMLAPPKELAKEPGTVEVQSTPPVQNSVKASIKVSIADASPTEMMFDGKRIVVTTWKDVYVNGIKELYNRYPQKFVSLIGDAQNSTGVYIETAYRAHKLKSLRVLTKNNSGQWLYLETEKSPDDAMESLYKLMDYCGVARTVLVVRRNGSTATPEVAKPVVSAKPTAPVIEKVVSTSVSSQSLEEPKKIPVPEVKKTVRTPANANSAAFYNWMRNEQHLAESSSRSYASAINNCEQLARQLELDSTALYGVPLEIAIRTKNLLVATHAYTAANSRQNNRLRAALSKYIQYLSTSEGNGPSKELPASPSVQKPATVTSQHSEPSPTFKQLLQNVEQTVLDADLDGITLAELYQKIHSPDVAIREAISSSHKIALLAGKLYHEEAFVDWNAGASQLEKILEKLMERNDGYVSDTQLYEYVRTEMQMFLNDNGIDGSEKVYDLARHLFGKVGYDDKHYSFSNKTHISRVGNEQIGSILDVMRRYAEEQGGIFEENDLVRYLQSIGLKTGNLHGQMKLNDEPIFLYYQPDTLITGKSLHLNEAWFEKTNQALDKLFADLGDHVILRDIQSWWYSQLPELPGDRPWTPLLLQSILGFYSKKLGGAKTICGMSSQSKDTLHAMLVSGSSEIQTFADAVAAWYIDDGIVQTRFQAEDLREMLVDRGLLAGSELFGRLHKALVSDPRFAWSADNATVTINL